MKSKKLTKKQREKIDLLFSQYNGIRHCIEDLAKKGGEMQVEIRKLLEKYFGLEDGKEYNYDREKGEISEIKKTK